MTVYVVEAERERVRVMARLETPPGEPLVIGCLDRDLHLGESLFGVSFQTYLEHGVGALEISPESD